MKKYVIVTTKMRKTLKDVARKARVSVSVVSRALGSYGYVSQESQGKVLRAAEKNRLSIRLYC